MRKVYYLSTCDTCARIIKELGGCKGMEMQCIKTTPMTAEQLDAMQQKVGSYEALFSRNALKYRSMELNKRQLTEADYRSLILEEYTFLKRPVFIIDEDIFVGNAPSVVAAAKARLGL